MPVKRKKQAPASAKLTMANRLTFRLFADALTKVGLYGTPIHAAATRAWTSGDKEAETEFYERFDCLSLEEAQRYNEYMKSLAADPVAVARRYARQHADTWDGRK